MTLLEQIKQGLVGTVVTSENFQISDEDWFLLDGEEWYIGEDIGLIDSVPVDPENLILLPYITESNERQYYGFVIDEDGETWLWYDVDTNCVNRLEKY